MKTLKLFILLASTAIVFATMPVAFAQQGLSRSPYDDMSGYDNPQGRGDKLSEQKREELRKKIETVRIWRLTETLKLDTTTSAKLSSLLSSLDQQRKDIMREQVQTMKALRQSLKSAKPDEAKLKTALDKLEQNHRIMQELRDKEISGLKEILTIEQQARYLLFQQEFGRKMRNMVAGARGNRAQGPGPGMGGPAPNAPGRQQDR